MCCRKNQRRYNFPGAVHFRFVFILVILKCVNTENSTLSLLQYQNTMYCVLSKDTTNTAITWGTQAEKISYDYYNITKLGGIKGDNWNLVNFLENEFELSPILDYRWESLRLLKRCRHGLPDKGDYKISVSILDTNRVYLCETKENEQCYAILFGENGPNGYTTTTNATGYCSNYNETYQIKDWLHFTLTYKSNVFTVKQHGFTKTTIFQNVFHPKFLVIGGRWKLHSYMVYSSHNTGEIKLLLRDEEICLGLFIRLTTTHIPLTLTLLNEVSDSLASVTSTTSDKWEEVRLCGNFTPNTVVTLQITPKFRHSTKFYIADTIRKISKYDIRTKTPKNRKTSHCCYAIATSTKICSDDLEKSNIKRETKGNQPCSYTDIGTNCIPCKTIFNKTHCENVPICEMKVSNAPLALTCSCPSGYTSSRCSEKCHSGFYGFNCIENCKGCTTCNHINGVCERNTQLNNCHSTDGPHKSFIVTTQNRTLLSVYLDKGKCNVEKGSVSYDIYLHCISDWCLPNNSYHMNSTEDFTYFTVLGYTNYTITIEAYGDTPYKRAEKTFETAPTVPHSVRNITIYRTTNESAELRWLDPFPPTGLLEVYIISYLRYSGPPVIRNVIANSSFCKIWRNYTCSKFHGLIPNVNYTFRIYAKNKNVNESSLPAVVSTTTEDKVPAPPENLNYFWNETTNNLALKWNYPNIPIGNITYFKIEINGKQFSVMQEQNECSYEVKYEALNVTSSTDITLRMFSYNSKNGRYSSESTLNIPVPPKTPKFAEDPVLVNVTGTSITFLLSKVIHSDGDNSFLYIIIGDTQYATKNGDAVSNDAVVKLLKEAEAGVHSWIAYNDTIDNSTENLREIRTETLLKANAVYQITLLLHNQYKNLNRYSSYTLDLTTSSTGDYKLYLLLALIPVVGLIIFIVYRLYKWKRSKSEVTVRFSKQLFPEEHTYEELDPLPKDLNNSKELSVENSKYSNRIKLQDLQNYVKTCLDKQEFEKQYEMFQMGQTQEWQSGTRSENQSKNRYKNIAAYDHTRVKLKIINNDLYSDYINANYIDGFNTTKAYIATQGPKQNTLNDFWRMIWQENVEYIIMIANITENGKKKITKYWPDINETKTYGDISVTFSEILVFAEYENMTFKVSNQGKERTVSHLHFTCWPDHGIPFYPQSLAPFLKRTVCIPNGRSPIVVHCSAGVGRTGTLILCDICLRMAAKTGHVDVSYHLHKLREQRINMVDNISQYKLVHLVLLHCLIEPDFTIQCTEEMEKEVNKIIVPKRISEQMKFIDDTFWQDEAMLSVSAKITEPVVQEKNRFSKVLPDCYSRLVLIPDPPSDESSKYINAIKVDGFCELFKFIVTQYPLSNTVGDFWRLVDQNTVSVIICLNTLDLTDKTCCKFYPKLKESMQPIPYMDIECTDVTKETYYKTNTLNMKNANTQQERIIKVIHLNKWMYSMLHPETPAALLMTYEEMNSLGKTSNTILVTCLDGSRASGLYTSLCCLIDKIKMEQVCDVCLAVRTVRHSRMEFVREAEQFSFLYKCGLDYVQQFELYSNFCSRKKQTLNYEHSK